MLMSSSAAAGDRRQPHDVYCVDVFKWSAESEELDCLMSKIQEEERARLKRFRMDIDLKRSLVGRILLRWMVHAKTGLPWSQIKFGRTEYNKPYLENHSEEKTSLNLNISHHGNWVAGTNSTDAIVGIDVMRYERPRGCKSIPDFFDTMQDNCTKLEWKYIKDTGVEPVLSNAEHAASTAPPPQNVSTISAPTTALPSSSTTKASARKQSSIGMKESAELSPSEFSQLRKFYLHWALKESYVKAIGVGLGFKFSRAEFRFSDNGERPPEVVLFIDGVRQNEWTFSIFEPDVEHCVVVALGPFTDAATHFQEVLAPAQSAQHNQTGKQYSDVVNYHTRTVAQLKES